MLPLNGDMYRLNGHFSEFLFSITEQTVTMPEYRRELRKKGLPLYEWEVACVCVRMHEFVYVCVHLCACVCTYLSLLFDFIFASFYSLIPVLFVHVITV